MGNFYDLPGNRSARANNTKENKIPWSRHPCTQIRGRAFQVVLPVVWSHPSLSCKNQTFMLCYCLLKSSKWSSVQKAQLDVRLEIKVMAKNPVNVPNTASSMENTSNIHRIICQSYVDISVNKNTNSFKVSLLCIFQSRVT